jgi:TfoX/Sxy family transcriptional regulator of competence genes
MASSKKYLDFILGQLSELEDITYRAMMGEYILYYKGKIVGGIYDDRLLVKPVKAAIAYMPTASYELPYDGAKEMLMVDEVDQKIHEQEPEPAMQIPPRPVMPEEAKAYPKLVKIKQELDKQNAVIFQYP